MNKLREIIRCILTTEMTNRMIGRYADVSHNTVGRYRNLMSGLKTNWNDIEVMDDTQLLALLHKDRTRMDEKALPDWNVIHDEMQKSHVTLQLLWEEYCLANPGRGYAYSQFTHYYRKFTKKLDITMRQRHRAGECVYVDFCGRTISYFDKSTDEEKKAQIFVGVLGCSNYAFAYAVASQKISDWIAAHNGMFQYFNGVPQIIVPDNLKSAVIKPGYDPDLNRTYLEMSKHYKATIIPARVRHPKDKSKAELTVRLVYRWILAKLRHQKFFCLGDINAAIAELLKLMNERPFKKIPGCRRSRFEELDKPMLRPLPSVLFEYAEWTSQRKVGPDYHFAAQDHYYSVPHGLVGEYVDARVSAHTVEIFHRNKRVASHIRSQEIGGHTTLPEHQPKAHRYYSEQTYDNLMSWAKSIGKETEAAIQHQFDSQRHALLGIKSGEILKRLAKDYGPERFEAACQRAQLIGSLSIKSIRSILKRRLTDLNNEHTPVQINLPIHDNVRGSGYYANGGY